MHAILGRVGWPVILATLLSVPLGAEQIVFQTQGWTVSAPDAIDCSKPPALTVRGPGAIFEISNRPGLEAITLGIGPGLIRQCPNLSEAVLVNGRTRRLVMLKAASQS